MDDDRIALLRVRPRDARGDQRYRLLAHRIVGQMRDYARSSSPEGS